MKKVSLVLFTILISLSLIVAGCSSSSESSNTSNSGSSSSTSKEAPKITITWWTDMSVKDVKGYESKTAQYGDYEKIIAAKFMEMHPNVTVNVEVLTWEDLPVKVPAALAAGTEPDIYKDYIGRSTGYAWQESLENMEDLFTKDELATFSETFMNMGKVNGIYHGIPLSSWGFAFVYNKAITDKLGTTSLFPTPEDPYWTLDEFQAAIKASKKDNYVPFAAQIGKSQGDQPLYLLLDAFGAKLFTNGDYSKTSINPKEALKAIETFAQMNKDGLLQPDVATAGYDETNKLAYNSQLVSQYYTAAIQPQIETALKEGTASGDHDWVLVAPPGEGNVVLGPTYLTVFKQDDDYKKDMIAEFIKLIMSDEFLLPYVKTNGQFAGSKSVLSNPDSTPTQNMKTLAKIISEKGAVDVGVASPKFAEFRPLLQPELQSVMLGKKTAQEALNDYEKTLNDVLKKK